MRGSLIDKPPGKPTLGIIPAHAGLTGLPAAEASFQGDHPRACGAHLLLFIGHSPMAGSSPRMRGSREEGNRESAGNGIIPAHAGLTYDVERWGKKCGDHPRACGAHWKTSLGCTREQGSSPRMRGSLSTNPLAAVQAGIIPAHAGLTIKRAMEMLAGRDHPRACGAHELPLALLHECQGSSPRMRGSLEQVILGQWEKGIIPAHAGLTHIL